MLADRGARDAAYVRRVIAVQRCLEVGGRVVLLGSRSRVAWWLGTTSLALSKVLDNMEIGHNVLHGQWDWMRDPRIHSSTWEWDHASAPAQWQRAHNDRHHANTNVLGMDNDLGYGILRVDEAQEWEPRHLAQPLWNLVNACIFEYGIAMYDLDLGESLRSGTGFTPEQKEEMRTTGASGRAQRVPRLRAAPAAVGADGLGPHHPDRQPGGQPGPQRVEPLGDHVRPLPRGRGDLRGRGGRRRTRRAGGGTSARCSGSADISGPPLLHVLCGNLSHQIEHHLFPDLPSNRYGEIAGPVRELFERHGLTYNTAPLWRQVASAWHKVLRLSLPPGRTGAQGVPDDAGGEGSGGNSSVTGCDPSRGDQGCGARRPGGSRRGRRGLRRESKPAASKSLRVPT